MSDEKRLSTTQLAKLRGVSQEQMFGQLSGKYGHYVAWQVARSLDAVPAESKTTRFQPSNEHQITELYWSMRPRLHRGYLLT